MDDPIAWLAEHAIPPEIATLLDPECVPEGIVLRLPTLGPDGGPGVAFEQRVIRDDLRGTVVQRADGSVFEWPKYLSRTGRGAIWRPVPRPSAETVVIVEGTKGHLAAAAYAPEQFEVWGIAGCQNWQADQLALPELTAVAGRGVIICMDGDVTSNADVHAAARRLADACIDFGADATRVRWLVSGSIGGKNGMDDVLAVMPPEQRAARLAGLLSNAKTRLPAAPARRERPVEASSQDVDADELSVAQAFAKHFGTTVRFDAVGEHWLIYGGTWQADGATAVVRRAYHQLVDGIVRPVGEAMVQGVPVKRVERRWARSRSVRDAVLSMAAAEDPITHFGAWDPDPHLFATRTDTIDLRTGGARPADPADHITKMAGCAWDPIAAAPEFDRFLAQALPDPEVRAYLQRVLGMTMLGTVREHVLPVLVGDGRNGKGTLLRIVQAAFGSYGTTANRSLVVEARNPGHLTEVETLRGKRLAVIQETSREARWDVTRINMLTGGDQLVARGMNQDESTFSPSHTLILATNHRPEVQPGESAFWSRYREVPFSVSFEGREDPGLSDRIVATELSGVLRWLLDGYAAYTREGLVAPAIVQLADTVARIEANEFGMFVAETFEVTGSAADEMMSKDIWTMWTNHRGMNPAARACPPNAPRELPKALAAHDPRIQRGRRVTQGQMVTGLRLPTGGHDANRGSDGANMAQRVDLDSRVSPGNPPTYVPNVPNVSNIESKSVVREGVPIQDQTRPPTPPDEHNRALASFPSLAPGDHGVSAGQTPYVASGVCPMPDVSAGQPGHAAVTATIEAPPADPSIGPLVLDTEGGPIETRYGHHPEGYVHIAGVSGPGGYTDTVDHPAGPQVALHGVAHLLARAPLAIAHNLLGFDASALARQFPDAGIDILRMTRERRAVDTMVIDATLNPPPHDDRPGFVRRAMAMYSLDASCARHGIPGKTDHAVELAEYHGGWDRIPLRDAAYRDYLAGDVDAHARLAAVLLPQMTEYAWREQRVAAIAATMTAHGVLVDEPLGRERHGAIAVRRLALKAELVGRYGIPTLKADGKTESDNPAATKGGKAAIADAFTALGVRQLPRTATGELATGREPMDELIDAQRSAQGPRWQEIADLATVVKDMSGLRTVYGTALANLREDGRVHPGVAMFQASGRWSLTDPGMTVYGKRNGRVTERQIFRAAPGHKLITADMSQIDARAIAVHSQDPAYMALFEPGVDSHDEVAALVWGEWDRASGHHPRRFDAKAIGHGWNYGMGLDKLSRTAGVSLETAEQFDATMVHQFGQLVSWRDWIRERARNGEVLDNGFGRPLFVNPDRAWTQGPALMGQGTARDLMMQWLLNIDDTDPDITRMMWVQVHDEAGWEVPADQVDEVSATIAACGTFEWAPLPTMRSISITVEVGAPGDNWMDCYA
ncbi:MAG TPA: phage/plasmid primase, P4 family [Pseudonocardiaceae bacterium]